MRMEGSVAKRPFRIRSFVSMMLAGSGFALAPTGLADHLNHDWAPAHVILGVIFVAFAIWHSVLNRRALLKWMRPAARVAPIGREAAWATTTIASVLVACVHFASV
jgi:hypothetical protein